MALACCCRPTWYPFPWTGCPKLKRLLATNYRYIHIPPASHISSISIISIKNILSYQAHTCTAHTQYRSETRNHCRQPIRRYTVSQKNCATFIFTVTLANVGRFLKFFQCRNQKEMAHNKNKKFPTVA